MEDEETSVKASDSASTAVEDDIPGFINSNIQAGRELLESYLSADLSGPFMLPCAPRQKFVDYYSDKDLEVGRKADYDSKRIDYEAECAVYRVLENLNHKFIVIHGFRYFKKQWNLLCANPGKDREHDFVVIVPSSAVICIEVKRPDGGSKKKYTAHYDKAKEQTEKCEQFLKALIAHHGTQLQYNVSKICAFPLTCRNEGKSLNIPEREDVPILWKDDIGPSLLQFLSTHSNVSKSISDVEALIVGLWVKNQNKTDKTKEIKTTWDLIGNTIKQTNDQLKSQELYFKAMNRPENLKPVPKQFKEIFKHHLYGIEYITQEQECLLEFSQESDTVFKKSSVLINGCAGSGKTLIMCARILKLLQIMKEKEQIVLLLPWTDAAEKIWDMIRGFDRSITIKILDLVHYIRELKNDTNLTDLERIQFFKRKLEKCRETVIIFVRPNFSAHGEFQSPDFKRLGLHSFLLDTLKRKRIHIFCDDFHSSFAHSMLQDINNDHQTEHAYNIEPLAEFLLQNCIGKSDTVKVPVWISCDFMQVVHFRFWEKHELQSNWSVHLNEIYENLTRSPLSGNVRNCHNIASLLINLITEFLKRSRNCEDLRKILPGQSFLHFVEGFATKLYCVDTKDYENNLKNIIRKELKMISLSYQAANIQSEKVAVIPVYSPKSTFNRKKWSKKIRLTVENIAKVERLSNMPFCDFVAYANSMEFPCAILVVDLSHHSPISEERSSMMQILSCLYSGISRARVYCSIILIGSEKSMIFKEIREILLPHVNEIKVSS